MLPSSLLRVRIYGRSISPSYARFGGEELEISRALIDLYRRSVSGRYGRLLEGLERLEREAEKRGVDYRLFRGLNHLLSRRLVLRKPELPVDPLLVRRKVFRTVNELYGGFVLDGLERAEVFKRVAAELGVSIEDVWRAFNAVYEEEMIVEEFLPPSPEDLLREYNLSLTQTLLFRCLRLDVTLDVTGYEAKIFLRRVKRLGLLYMAEKLPRGVRLSIDGPASILKHTERYGTRMAKLVPLLLHFRRWRIEALISSRGRRSRGKRRFYWFRLSDRASYLLPRRPVIEEELFDSGVEEGFAREYMRLGLPWRLLREPEPLVAGTHIFIPDFAFEHDGRRVYLEIVGFWTEDYLRRKVEKLSVLREPIIVAIDESLGEFKVMGEGNIHVVRFRGSLLPGKVVPIVRMLLPVRAETRVKRVVNVEDVLGGELDGLTLGELERKLRALGFKDVDLLESLKRSGYRVRWRGISPEDAFIERVKGPEGAG